MEKVVEITIVRDPYEGLYSGGKFIAFDAREIVLPNYVLTDCNEFDNEQFWDRYKKDPDFPWFKMTIVVGNTEEDVIKKFNKKKELD